MPDTAAILSTIGHLGGNHGHLDWMLPEITGVLCRMRVG
jgi:hypothetical protein